MKRFLRIIVMLNFLLVFTRVLIGVEVPRPRLLQIRTSLSNGEVYQKLYYEKTNQCNSLTVISSNQKKIIHKQNKRINKLERRGYLYIVALGVLAVLGYIF